MKNFNFIVALLFMTAKPIVPQQSNLEHEVKKQLNALIEQYNEARDNKDTSLLKTILTPEMDQLVSSGEWRVGIDQAISGMMRSSVVNPGNRKLTIEKIRLMNQISGVVDARYKIESSEGPTRKMRSSFLVVFSDGHWKITGIRNMLPTSNQN